MPGPRAGVCAWSGEEGVPGPRAEGFGLGGVPGPGGSGLGGGWCVWSGGVCLVGGLGSASVPSGIPPSPPVNRITNRCKNITLATTSLRPVTIS